MIYLDLFWTFLKIGLFTIGGGQAMIPMIMTNVVNKGWLSETQLIDFIAISESTPGPFAVNIATYAGIKTAGIGGALTATLGVVLPSVIIILIIAIALSSFMKRPAVAEVFSGVRATVTGLLASVFLTLLFSVLLGVGDPMNMTSVTPDYTGMIILAIVVPFAFVKVKKRSLPPVALILLSAALGALFYGLFDHFGITL